MTVEVKVQLPDPEPGHEWVLRTEGSCGRHKRTMEFDEVLVRPELFAYVPTGETRPPRMGEWFMDDSGFISEWNLKERSLDQEIFRKIPWPPAPKDSAGQLFAAHSSSGTFLSDVINRRDAQWRAALGLH